MVGAPAHGSLEADHVPHLAEEGQSEGTSGGDSRAGNGRFLVLRYFRTRCSATYSVSVLLDLEVPILLPRAVNPL